MQASGDTLHRLW